MGEMSAVEALMVQRDAVMFGWMPCPDGPNLACAVIRIDANREHHSIIRDSREALHILMNVSRELHGCDAISFNYRPATTLADMLDLFDEAIRRAKELEDS